MLHIKDRLGFIDEFDLVGVIRDKEYYDTSAEPAT